MASTMAEGGFQDITVKWEQESKKLIGEAYSTRRNRKSGTRKRFSCLVCRKRYESRSLLKNHVSKHIFNVPMYQCKTCKRFCKDRLSVLVHKEHTHGGDKSSKGYAYNNSYVCTLCGRRCTKKVTCVEHVLRHSSMVHECVRCGWTFDTLYRMHVHVSLWHMNTRISAVSTPFNKGMRNKAVWQHEVGKMDVVHQIPKNVSSEEESTHKSSCPTCNRKLYKEALEDHVKNHDKLTYKCQEVDCGWMYEDYNIFQSHCTEKHGVNITQKSKECPFCTRRLYSKAYYDHVNNHEKMKFTCPEADCAWMFESYSLFQAHCKKKHELIIKKEDYYVPIPRRSQCPICNRGLNKMKYDDHVKNHDNMKYKCQQADCGWMFEEYFTLQAHCSKKHRLRITKDDKPSYSVLGVEAIK